MSEVDVAQVGALFQILLGSIAQEAIAKQTRIGLGSKLVAKFSQLVALVVIASVLGATQCAELCSALSLAGQAQKIARAHEPVMPCHKKYPPNNSQPPSDELCAHYEIVAEKRAAASPTHHLQVVFVVARLEPQIVPLVISYPITKMGEHSPTVSSLTLNSILRI